MEHEEETQEDAAELLMYHVERPVYNEDLLQSQLLRRRERSPVTLRRKLSQNIHCSSEKAKALALSFLPILTWLPSYPVKQYLFSDVVSGLSTGVVQLPQGLAYAMLAAVPPVYGLYSSFYPVLLYTFFGTSRHVSIGTFAVISLMIGSVAVREVPDSLPTNGTNVSHIADLEMRDAKRVEVAVVVATLVGIIQLVLGLLRFGFVAIYLSEPLVRGFTTAAAVHVCVSQLKYLLGVKTERFGGPLAVIFSVVAVFSKITSTNVVALSMGLMCIAFLYGIKILNERFKKKLPFPIPGELMVVIVCTGASFGLSLSSGYNVEVVGKIPTGLAPPAIPSFSRLPNLVTDSFAIAIVGFSMGISLAKIFAIKHSYSVDNNQELIAMGLCNFISSFFQTFPITCSMSRSLVQESTGGKTQIAGLVASLLVLLVILAIGFVFEPLPQTVLSAIIIVNLFGMFKQARDIPALWKTSKIELAIWLIAFLASVLLGLDYGLLVSLAFGMLTVVYRTQSSKSAILGHVRDTGLYCDVEEYGEATECVGIKIFHTNSSVYFANSDLYVNTLKDKTGVNPAMILAEQESRDKLKEAKEKENEDNSPDKMTFTSEDGHMTHELVSWNHADENTNNHIDNRHDDSDSEVAIFLEPLNRIHSIILDWTPVNFVDSVGAKAIKTVIKEYAAVDVQVFIAGCSRTVLAELDTLQFFTGVVTPEIFFPTIHDAVLYCQHRRALLLKHTDL